MERSGVLEGISAFTASTGPMIRQVERKQRPRKLPVGRLLESAPTYCSNPLVAPSNCYATGLDDEDGVLLIFVNSPVASQW